METKYLFVPQTDIIGPGAAYDTTYPNFGIYAYKNQQSGQNVRLSAHIQDLVEMGCGAHYYAQGMLSCSYVSAEATVDLDAITLNLAGRRAACLSLNFTGAYGSCDVGIENEGNGWFCTGWSKQVSTDWGDRHPVRSGASKCTIKVSVSGSSEASGASNGYNRIQATFDWYKANGTKLYTDVLTCCAEKNPIFDMGYTGGPSGRFTRFMSLILLNSITSTPENDYNDGSFMNGGNFSDVRITDLDGHTVDWTEGYFEYIWSVQGWNITECSVGGRTDRFSLAHKNNVYAK